jgi:hypothetical protein
MNSMGLIEFIEYEIVAIYFSYVKQKNSNID